MDRRTDHVMPTYVAIGKTGVGIFLILFLWQLCSHHKLQGICGTILPYTKQLDLCTLQMMTNIRKLSAQCRHIMRPSASPLTFGLKTGTPVTPAPGNDFTNFHFSMPFRFLIRSLYEMDG